MRGRLHGPVGYKGWKGCNPDCEEVPEPSTVKGGEGEGEGEAKTRESSHRIPTPWDEYSDIHMREGASEGEGCQKRGMKCMLPRLPRSLQCEISRRMEGGCGGLMDSGMP